MRIILSSSLIAVIAITLAAGAFGQSSAPSLGDYARAVRKKKPNNPAAKVYDNDNLPASDHLSVVGAPKETSANDSDRESKPSVAAQEKDSKATPQEKAEEKKPSGETKPGQSPAEREQAFAVWKERIAGQKNLVDLTARELDVLQREYRLRSAAFYSDAGARLRDPGQWDTDDAKYKQNIADKQKALDSARAKLSQLEEEARKSGAPSSVTE